MEETEYYRLNDNLQLHFIELKKWTKLSVKARNRLERWLLFLADNNPVELEEIAMKDVSITKALEAEKMFLSDKQARYIYDLREKSKRDLLSTIAAAEERADKRGEKRGEERGVKKIAIRMLGNDKFSLDDIAENTGLSIAELETLKTRI